MTRQKWCIVQHNEYIIRYSDEYHLLIVYSFGYEDENTGFNEFHWHVMWGDDLGRTIHSNDEDFLADELQREYARANGKNVAKATADAVDSLYKEISAEKTRIDNEQLIASICVFVMGLVFGGSGAYMIVSSVKGYKKSQEKGEQTYRIDGEPIIKTCQYCQCTYYAGTVGTCVHCGAPLEI